MVMIIKHDKVGVLNPCDNNQMIVNKNSSDSCHKLYVHTTVLSAFDFCTQWIDIENSYLKS